jgi:hypothetical protein
VERIQIHLSPWAEGIAAAFGKIAIMEFHGYSFPGIQVGAQRKASAATRALAPVEHPALQGLETFVHLFFSISSCALN